ncbi:hypothetical protein MMYC01_209743, partial [Madurella mycetomatis]
MPDPVVARCREAALHHPGSLHGGTRNAEVGKRRVNDIPEWELGAWAANAMTPSSLYPGSGAKAAAATQIEGRIV